jgi:hypothetical protein
MAWLNANVRFIHIYGGLTMLVAGLSWCSPALGVAIGGAFLIYLGLTWVK